MFFTLKMCKMFDDIYNNYGFKFIKMILWFYTASVACLLKYAVVLNFVEIFWNKNTSELLSVRILSGKFFFYNF